MSGGNIIRLADRNGNLFTTENPVPVHDLTSGGTSYSSVQLIDVNEDPLDATYGGIYGLKVHVVGDGDKYCRGISAEGATTTDLEPVLVGAEKTSDGTLVNLQTDDSKYLKVTQQGTVTVDLGANNDVTVTGSVTANAGTNLNTSALALESGGNLASINTKLVSGTDIGDVTINNSTGGSAVNIQDGGNTITVDGTVAVTFTDQKVDLNKVAGESVQVAGGTEAKSIRVTIANDSTGLLSVDDNGGSLTVDGTVTANLAAGNNNVGDVDVASIAAGDNNIGNVDVVTLPNVKPNGLKFLEYENIAVSDSSVLVVDSDQNANSVAVTVANCGVDNIYLMIGASATANIYHKMLQVGETWEFPLNYVTSTTNDINGIRASAQSGVNDNVIVIYWGEN